MWMKLMELHGPNGTVDEVLKYRTSDLAREHAVKVLKCAKTGYKMSPKYGPDEHRLLMVEYYKAEIEGGGTPKYGWGSLIHKRTRNTILNVYDKDSIYRELKKLLQNGDYANFVKSLDAQAPVMMFDDSLGPMAFFKIEQSMNTASHL